MNGAPRQPWQNELMWLPRLSAAWQFSPKMIIRGGYGVYYDSINVQNVTLSQSGFSRTTSTNLTNDFGVNWLAGNPKAGVPRLRTHFLSVVTGRVSTRRWEARSELCTWPDRVFPSRPLTGNIPGSNSGGSGCSGS